MENKWCAGSKAVIIAITPVPHPVISVAVSTETIITVIVPVIPAVVAIIPVPAVLVVMIIPVTGYPKMLITIGIIVTVSIV
jgi:hypothetical protein